MKRYFTASSLPHPAAVLWLPAAALLVWVLLQAPLREALAILQQLRPAQLLALVGLNGLIALALSGRWWLILRAQGYRIPYLILAGHRLAGFGVSYFTPGPQFGGEPLQVALLTRQHGVPGPAALAAVTLDKLLELLVNFLFLAGGVGLVLQQALFAGAVGGETAVFALLLLLAPALFLAATWAGWLPVARLLRVGGRLPWPAAWRPRLASAAAALRDGEREATRFCQAAPGALLAALAVSLAGWGLMIAEFWLLLRFLGLPLSLAQAVAVLTAARLAFLLPAPGALGALEASLVLALQWLGLNPAAGLSASLLIRARDVSLGIAGLWWGGWRWRRARQTAVSTD